MAAAASLAVLLLGVALIGPIKGYVLLALQQMWPGVDSVGKFKIDEAAVLKVFTLNLESGGH